MVSHKTAVLIACLAASGLIANSLVASEHYAVATFRSTVDGSDQPYALYLPAKLDAGRRYPLVVSLHGAGQTHRQGLRQVFGIKADAPLPEVDYIVAAPYGRGSMGYEGIAETDVFDMLSHVKRQYPVDEDRVYLTGVSMGGSGTLAIALRRPDLWAAIAVVCGGAPSGSMELAGNAVNFPVHLFHGDKDTVVPIDIARQWRKEFTAADVELSYREFAEEGHNIAPLAYKDGYIFDWFGKFRRNRTPPKVRFSTRAYRHNSAYWIQIDSFDGGQLATVNAKEARGTLSLETAFSRGLTLDLRHRKTGPVSIDGNTLDLPSERVHLRREHSGWIRSQAPVSGGKRDGREGPLISVLGSGHSYVYGTLGGTPAEVWQRAETVQRAADWSGRRARPAASFPVLADQEVKSSTGNLVVFGTGKTNRLLKEWSRQLPMELRAEASDDYGLAFLYPVGERLVLVSSGLPWWIGATEEQQNGFRFQWLSLPYRLLIDLPDYVLFHKGIGDIVASGTFDADWKLRPHQAEILRKTGVIQVQE